MTDTNPEARRILRTRGLGLLLWACVSVGACTSSNGVEDTPRAAKHLFVWSGDADSSASDFLAVIDVAPESPAYGEVVATLAVGAKGAIPHHTEYEYFSGNTLLANGWVGNETFVIDLANPRAPVLKRRLRHTGALSYPHSYARLPNGNVLATFQGRKGRYGAPGGLAEVDESGTMVRESVLDPPKIPTSLYWPYSLAVDPKRNLAIVSLAEMGLDPRAQLTSTRHVQLWSASDLTLRATVELPRTKGDTHLDPAEPRLLADGTIYVNTFSCGLFRLTDVDTASPAAEHVFDFTSLIARDHAEQHANMGGCAVPVVYGKYWIQTVPGLPGLVALDVSDPAHPKEASRLVLDKALYGNPHWLAADRTTGRLVVTGSHKPWVLVVDFDDTTGAMTIDDRFRDKGKAHPGVSFDRQSWPHGTTGPAWVHGALFGG
jgi:hypothetical protein